MYAENENSNVYQFERPARVAIECIDGRTYVGATLREAVQRMRSDAWGCPSRTFDGYVKQCARRAFMWAKRPVRVDTVENFTQDLEASGLITIRTLSVKN